MRRARLDLVLAAALPAACLAALLVTAPDAGRTGQEAARPPSTGPLREAQLVCPSPAGRGGAVRVVAAPGASGDVLVGLGDLEEPLVVTADTPARIPAKDQPVPITAVGDLAPGLVAGRWSEEPLTATDCRPPVGEQWFAGLGAGATHSSVVELVNPTEGPAVADITLFSQAGPIQVPNLLGVAVAAGRSVDLDLDVVVPRRGELTAQVRVSRGRLAVSVLDSVDALAGGVTATDLLAPQAEPASRLVLLGLGRGEGDRLLVLGNPGADELRATVKVLTPRAAFAPIGLEPITIAPGSTKPVALTAILRDATDQGAIGVLVEASGPVVGVVRQETAGDVSHVPAAAPIRAATAAVVPPGTARLLLADPSGVGVADVVAYDAGGAELGSQTVELAPGLGATVPLPEGTALVRLTPRRTSVHAALLVFDRRAGTAVVPLRDLELTDRVPDVRPGLP